MTSTSIDYKSLLTEIDLLCETSWEVCNKVGGIYTVLSTKAKELQGQFGDKLIFIGPDIWSDEKPSPVFKENKRLLKSFMRYAKLPNGVSVRTGRWDIPGSPIVILVNYQGVYDIIDGIFGNMWNNFHVDSLHGYGDYRESCVFAVASALVIQSIAKHLNVRDNKILAHFDEWTTGMGLLYLRLHNPQIATIFTTHATSIGRSICGNGKPLYQYFHNYNGDQMAHELNMESKHSLEKAAAHNADCFTTVSDVTADECEQLLGIRPQVVTPNGFDPDFVPSLAKRKKQRTIGRDKILSIAQLMTGKLLPDDTFIVATSGRNEFRNKGIDLFLDSIADIRTNNNQLKKPVLALVLVPAWVKQPAGELITDLYNNGDIRPQIDFLTHRLNNEDNDSITCKIKSMGGNQNTSDVSIIYIPCYLDGFDGILNINYYDFIPALDMTIFPSYYEPWGYTPLESIAFGIPTLTTDKSGFGMWIENNTSNDLSSCGVKVIPRSDSNYQQNIQQIAETIMQMVNATPQYIGQCSKAAFKTADKAEWKFFIRKYDKAFSIALHNRDSRITK
ncbi:MAG: glycosyltransferase [Prevotella sp.]|nr:glycosyltransferase [Bacteroides sp.]MCM1366529.1 glycosyltransferase [Prevotella sp.]